MIKLFLFNNVYRKEVGQVPLQELLSEKDIHTTLMQKFQELGCVVQPGRGELRIMEEKDLLPFDEKLLLPDDVTVVYLDIVKPDNAAEYDRQNGIVYFFHTSEKGHLSFPHIHAKYSGEEISIYFNDLNIIGQYKSRAKQREAVKYVETHLDDLRREWMKIVQ